MRTLVIAAVTSVLGLTAVGRGLGHYGARHFLPQQRMDAANAEGEGCILILGDSRMEAAFDAAAFHRGLRAVGPDRCHVALAIGATDAAGHFLTARQYLARGHRPSVAILGVAGDSLLGSEEVLQPEDMVGNQAIHLAWTEPRDVFAEVPGFPTADIAAFDAGFRFLMGRATSFGRYQSMASLKTQQLARALAGRAEVPLNRFGAVGDMARLEDGLRSRAPERLAIAMRVREDGRLGAWFPRTAALLEERGARLMVVELPMPRLYRGGVEDLPQTIAYQKWLAAALGGRGDRWLDLSREPWVEDGLFVDALHLGEKGAALVSMRLGREVGLFLATAAGPTNQGR